MAQPAGEVGRGVRGGVRGGVGGGARVRYCTTGWEGRGLRGAGDGRGQVLTQASCSGGAGPGGGRTRGCEQHGPPPRMRCH